MSIRKDLTVFVATFRNLKLTAWGIDQVIKESFSISVYQVCCRPARWAARPQLFGKGHKWEGMSAEAVMQFVAGDFEVQLSDWAKMPAPRPAQPSLRSGADVDQPTKRA